MKILIVYATTEGQTRKVARFAFDRLAGAGHSVELVPAGEAQGRDGSGFDGVLAAGSVHAGRYQKELVDWARGAADGLRGRPGMFLSVSLTAAGEDADDWTGLHGCVDRFVEETGWTPSRVEHVAGAFRFSEYDFFKSWAMRWIAAQKDESARPGEDKEYTDWDALGRVLEDWTAGLAAGR
jgi:menaquinone-dependent protoporphyrinogen oxidase